MAEEAFNSYELFNSLKLHFTNKKYDYFKYKGKTLAGKYASRFDKQKDRKVYHNLWAKYKTELKGFYISVIISGDVPWAGSLLTEKYHDQYNDWVKRQHSLQNIFKNDVDTIVEFMIEYGLDFKTIIMPNGNTLPKIIQLEEQDFISLETVVIINRLTNFVNKGDCKHPTWSDKQLLLTRYQPFVKVSKLGRFASMLKDGIDKLN